MRAPVVKRAPDVDCVGAWSRCRTNCRKAFLISTTRSGTGAQCEAPHGTPGRCTPGEGDCTEARDPVRPSGAAPPPRTPGSVSWTLGGGITGSAWNTGSCDAVCAALGEVCLDSELAALNGAANSVVIGKYRRAGLGCEAGLRIHCEAGDNCEAWGAPYVHNTHLHEGVCWAGSPPAPCDATPVDSQHRRLCPCSGSADPAAQAPPSGDCAALCRADGHCCNDHTVGSNQLISCAQACTIRQRGTPVSECLELCSTRAQERGCSTTVNGFRYNHCQTCRDLHADGRCPHGVQSEESCRAGCRLLQVPCLAPW